MNALNWLATNWHAVLSILTAVLAVGVMVAHLIHADSTATKIQSIEDTINNISTKL